MRIEARRQVSPRVVRAEPNRAVVTVGVLKGTRVAKLTGYQLEDLRDWTDAQIEREKGAAAGTSIDRLRALEGQAKAIKAERERRWAELTAP